MSCAQALEKKYLAITGAMARAERAAAAAEKAGAKVRCSEGAVQGRVAPAYSEVAVHGCVSRQRQLHIGR